MTRHLVLFLMLACKPGGAPTPDTGSPVGPPPPRHSGVASATQAPARIDSRDTRHLGWSFAGVGDINADGIGDLAVQDFDYTHPDLYGTNHGKVWLVHGGSFDPVTQLDEVADGSVVGTRDHEQLGLRITALGDWDGDGFDDFAALAPQRETTARVGILYGPVKLETRIDSADALLEGPDLDLQTIGGDVDLTGDGRQDLLVADLQDAWVFTGSLSGTVALGSAELHLPGALNATYAGDLDGDGWPSVVTIEYDPTRLTFIEAPLVHAMEVETAGRVMTVPPELDSVTGLGRPGDTDGDGQDELPVLMAGAYEGEGAVFLVGEPSGPASDLASEARAELTLEGGSGIGVTASVVGDLDADGLDDIAVSALATRMEDHLAAEDIRAVYLLYGPVVGHRDLAQADFTIVSDNPGEYAFAVHYVGDMDGDRHPDLAVGGGGDNTGEIGSGSVFLFLGGSAP